MTQTGEPRSCYHFLNTSNRIMRSLLALFVAALSAVYAVGALYFFEQERRARDPSALSEEEVARLRHPDALFGALQDRFAQQRFGPSELALARRALGEAPTFYQGPFFIATYHANRLENAPAIRSGFEAALERYPANGRLRVAYAMWLLQSRTSLSGWADPDVPGSLKDPLPLAEKHLRRGMELEPVLSWRALDALRAYRIPPERWVALTPDTPLARRHLLDALLSSDHYEAGFALLRERIEEMTDLHLLRTAARKGLEGGDFELALNAAQRWQTVLEKERGPASSSLEPALLMSRSYAELGDTEASDRVLEQTLARVEKKFGSSGRITLDFMCSLGDEYARRQQWLSAESFYGQALSRNGALVPALYGVAVARRRSGDPEGAIEALESVLRVDATHRGARADLKALLRVAP